MRGEALYKQIETSTLFIAMTAFKFKVKFAKTHHNGGMEAQLSLELCISILQPFPVRFTAFAYLFPESEEFLWPSKGTYG
ncbi:hypothetical protein NQ317_018855 [Molorchus minor]|uniref:Uncharacterized protein n=1 Tax=Molorchus minor TaxID=1323400 RepID=A0ABQ9J6W9_9CUCU|nr:hypothetical protein NQ317_018855 [Molorchus minor]